MQFAYAPFVFSAVLGAGLPAQTWQLLSPAAAPAPRFGHALAFSDARGVAVLFGGSNGNVELGDTWHFDGANWSPQAPPQSPPARSGHALAFDRARSRTVLFGGAAGGVVLADTWEYDGTTWTPAAGGPPARADTALAYDLARRRCVLFGGVDGSRATLADTWEHDGVTWTLCVTAVAPPPRGGHVLVHDSARGRTVLCGGHDATASTLADAWTYDGANWTPLAGPTPGSRAWHAAAFDLRRGRTLVFAGQQLIRTPFGTFGATFDDLWSLDDAGWTQLPIAATPGPRVLSAMAFDPARGTAIVFGGIGQSPPPTLLLGDTWRLVPPPVASVARHGSACTGSAGAPQFDAGPGSLPVLGGTLALQFGALPQGPLFLLFATDFVQWNGAPLPLAPEPQRPDCLLWISPAAGVAVAIAHSGPTANASLAIPATPGLAGLAFGLQALAIDAGSPAAGSALSNALLAQIR